MIRYTTILRMELVIDNSWGIGAFTRFGAGELGTDEGIQVPVQRRPDGSVHLPATSLVGSLRDHLGNVATKWFGSEKSDEKDSKTSPSKIRVGGAIVDSDAEIEVTKHVAIDASRRAAKGNLLFTRERVTRGTGVVWWLFWDRNNDGESELEEFLDAAKTWQPVLGSGRNADHGWGRLIKIQHGTIDRRDPKHLTWWLQQRPAALSSAGMDLVPPTGWSTVLGEATTDEPALIADFTVEDPLHLGTGELGKIEFNLGDGEKKVVKNLIKTGTSVPAESWRGIFRHRIAHVLHVTGHEPDPVVYRLFGSGRAQGSSDDAGVRGLLRFEASPVTSPHEGEPLPYLTNVGIDRISGGAVMNSNLDAESSRGSLFNVEYLPRKSTLQLRIHSSESLGDSERRLIDAVIQDLDDGIIGIGGMTTRGYGTIKLAGSQNWQDVEAEEATHE